MGCCIGDFYCCCDKDKLTKERLILSRGSSLWEGVVYYRASVVRKQREAKFGVQLPFSLFAFVFSPELEPMDGAVHIQGGSVLPS